MKRFTGRIAVITAGLAVTIVTLAGTASADTDSFLADLGNLGYPQSQSTRESAINVGVAMCNYLGAGFSKTDAMRSMENGAMHASMDEAAAWVVAATNDLCPQYR